MKYWLVKSEPSCYSIDRLKKERTTPWDGVRNYQARNFLMEMKKDDLVLFYHSNTKEIGIVGLAKVSKEHYPDHTAWNPKSEHPDPKSTPEKPRWFMSDIRFVKKYKKVLSLSEIKEDKILSNMKIAQKGSRLSVTPVEKKEFNRIEKILG
jgi:predicted RNA-binding protein with PUA-like domain